MAIPTDAASDREGYCNCGAGEFEVCTCEPEEPGMVLPASAVLHGWLQVASYLDGPPGFGNYADHLRLEARRRFHGVEVPPDWCPLCYRRTDNPGTYCTGCEEHAVADAKDEPEEVPR